MTAAGSQPLELFKYSMHSYSAMFCEVRVSAVTGEARVSRLLGSFDCGRILNPKTATSQFRGGMIIGMGLALRGDPVRRAHWADRERIPFGLSRASPSRRTRDRGNLDGHSRSKSAARRARDRRDRCHRNGGGDRQRCVQRHRQAGSRPSDHPGQTPVAVLLRAAPSVSLTALTVLTPRPSCRRPSSCAARRRRSTLSNRRRVANHRVTH